MDYLIKRNLICYMIHKNRKSDIHFHKKEKNKLTSLFNCLL